MDAERQHSIKRHIDSCAGCLRAFAALASEHHSLQMGNTTSEVPGAKLVPGETIGRFIVLHVVGQGGMGSVYAVYDPKLDRRVALKLLHRAGPCANKRLLKEARLLARVSHPNIIAIYDVGEHKDAVYLAMELVEGPSLLSHFKGAELADVVAYFAQVALGLAAAHEQGIVHRDIKPGNLLVGPHERAIVADFGLAEHAGTGESVAGTPLYMAPEQTTGDATALSDQYSLCVSLLQVLTGTLHRPGEALPSQTPEFLRPLVLRGLHKDPQQRFSDMGALALALKTRPRNRRWIAGLAVAGAVAAALVVSVSAQTEKTAPCQGSQRLFEDLWNKEIQTQLANRFDELPEFGKELWRATNSRFTSYRDDWIEHHREVCEATRVHKDQSETTMDRRMQCLDQRSAEFGGLISALQEASLEEITKAADAQALLIAPSACVGADPSPPLPADQALSGQISSLRAQTASWKAKAALGQLDPALQGLDGLQNEARATNYGPVIAETSLALGAVQSKTGKHDEAVRSFRTAIAEGTESRHDTVVADAWLQLSWVHGYHQERLDDADDDLQNGLAFANRISAVGILPMSYARNAGWVALRRGHSDKALVLYRQALALARELPNSGKDVAMLHSDLGSAYLNANKIEEAAEQFGLAFQSMKALLGPLHPDTLSIHNNYATLLKAQGNTDQAIVEFKEALTGFQVSMESSEVYEGQILNNLAVIYADEGDNALAEETYRQALEVMMIAYPKRKHANIARVINGLATVVQLDKERLAEAEQLHDEGLAMKEELLGSSHPSVAISLSGLAELYVVQGRQKDAKPVLVRALKILRSTMGDEHPQTQFVQEQLDSL